MTTLKQLDKPLKALVDPILLPFGFERRFAFDYVRVRGPFHDVVHGDILSSGENLRVAAYCWLHEVNPSIEYSKFPKGASFATGGTLGPSMAFPDNYLWEVATPAEVLLSLKRLSAVIVDVALPWFDSISSREAFVSELDVNLRDRPEWQEKIQRILRAG